MILKGPSQPKPLSDSMIINLQLDTYTVGFDGKRWKSSKGSRWAGAGAAERASAHFGQYQLLLQPLLKVLGQAEQLGTHYCAWAPIISALLTATMLRHGLSRGSFLLTPLKCH